MRKLLQNKIANVWFDNLVFDWQVLKFICYYNYVIVQHWRDPFAKKNNPKNLTVCMTHRGTASTSRHPPNQGTIVGIREWNARMGGRTEICQISKGMKGWTCKNASTLTLPTILKILPFKLFWIRGRRRPLQLLKIAPYVILFFFYVFDNEILDIDNYIFWTINLIFTVIPHFNLWLYLKIFLKWTVAQNLK